MGFPKIILWGTVGLFAVIGAFATIKKVPRFSPKVAVSIPVVKKPEPKFLVLTPPGRMLEGEFPDVNRIDQLFSTTSDRLPIVETLSYSSHVSWLKGRPAWIGDYSSYYSTSRHFIARSLNGKPDYFTQKVSLGSKFNVFRKDRNFKFHLLVDTSLCKMAFYYIDLDTQERVLLKTYTVGLGKKGAETPSGKYHLGEKIAVYKPGIMGTFKGKQVEMIQVFGTRWIPFEKDLGNGGYGIQGAPWVQDKKTGKWTELRQTVGAYDSDGCVRLNSEDMEELFSIVITKPTVIEIVNNFKEAQLPGIER